jgi:hypothetical protein
MMLRSFLVMVFCLLCHGLPPLKYSLQHAWKKACCLITIAHCGTYNLVNRRTRPGSPEKSPYLCFKAEKERLEKEDVFKQIDAGLPRAGLRDLHRMNLNQVLVKQGWCWWDRKYVPRDTFSKPVSRASKPCLIGSLKCMERGSPEMRGKAFFTQINNGRAVSVRAVAHNEQSTWCGRAHPLEQSHGCASTSEGAKPVSLSVMRCRSLGAVL